MTDYRSVVQHLIIGSDDSEPRGSKFLDQWTKPAWSSAILEAILKILSTLNLQGLPFENQQNPVYEAKGPTSDGYSTT